MTRMFKTLSAAALALLAIGALSIALASAAEFHSESEKTVTTGEQDPIEGIQRLTAGGSTITCNEARGEGTTTTKTVSALTLQPRLTTSGKGTGLGGCTFFGVGVTLNMRTCDYVLHSSGLVDIAGCSGAEPYMSFKATVLGSSCEIRTGNQTGLSKATFTNIGSGTTQEITVDIGISGIRYDAIGSLCNPAGLNQTNGTYTGKLTATGEGDPGANHVGLWWE